ncbi:MAG: glycoside hydrolase family 25 protein [Clostridiales bacterium]|nr:glycoside hydrolase family 25 protein [Clostridiales bacterium]
MSICDDVLRKISKQTACSAGKRDLISGYLGKDCNMTLKDKKFIPYYIAGGVLVLIAVLCVVIISASPKNEPEETTEPESTTLFMNGEVPYYEDVAASAYDKEDFTMTDEGRIVYSNASVRYTTGIDVSSHQGTIDWEKVAADGIEFAIIRIGYRGYGAAGNICEDEYSEENIKNASAAGLKVGVYFYSQAVNTDEALEEAEFVLDIIENYDIEYPVVFDWENEPDIAMRTDNVTGDELTDCAVSFCNAVKTAGYTPAIYLNLNNAYNQYDLSKIKQYCIWYAQHEGEQPEMYYSYTIWQYSDTGTVDGISGNVDLNISFSDFA